MTDPKLKERIVDAATLLVETWEAPADRFKAEKMAEAETEIRAAVNAYNEAVERSIREDEVRRAAQDSGQFGVGA